MRKIYFWLEMRNNKQNKRSNIQVTDKNDEFQIFTHKNHL